MSEPSIGTFCREPVRILHGREIPLTPTVQTSETGIISRPCLHIDTDTWILFFPSTSVRIHPIAFNMRDL